MIRSDSLVVVGFLAAVFGLACATPQADRAAPGPGTSSDLGFAIEEARVSSARARRDFAEALDHVEHGRHADALPLFEAVVDAEPEATIAYIDLALTRAALGDLEAARESLEAALEVQPGHPAAWNELGIVHRRAGRFADARRAYEAALREQPGFHHARRNLAILCDLYLRDLGCAIENYERYAGDFPDDADVAMWLRDLRARVAGE